MKHKVLIIVDMQNDFVTGSLGTKEAQEIIPNITEKIKNWRGDIIATKDTHDSNYLRTLEGKMLPVKHCIKGTDGWNFHPVIDEALRKKVKSQHGKPDSRRFHVMTVEKNTFGAMPLGEILPLETAECAYSGIELVGVCTNICVLANAVLLRTMYPNTPISVDLSCCAGTTPELHRQALNVMNSCQINIIGSDKEDTPDAG